jgi:hypothetical protein
MDEWLGWIALVVAILSVPITIWGTRQWGNRRARVEVSANATPLLPGDTREGLLEVTFRDIPVRDPHLVSVSVRNIGPRDLSTQTFDSGRPITVRFDNTFYGLTQVGGGVRVLAPAIGTAGKVAVVSLEPGLLKRGQAWSFSAITTGPVQVTVEAPLIDTDVREPTSPAGSRPEITLRLSLLGLSAEMPLRRRITGS